MSLLLIMDYVTSPLRILIIFIMAVLMYKLLMYLFKQMYKIAWVFTAWFVLLISFIFVYYGKC
jgi:hypothetical protein